MPIPADAQHNFAMHASLRPPPATAAELLLVQLLIEAGRQARSELVIRHGTTSPGYLIRKVLDISGIPVGASKQMWGGVDML